MVKYTNPPYRRLKGFAFDPSLSIKIDTAEINNLIYKVIWEDNLSPGPRGEYIEVIDYDPTIQKFYEPVDLNDSYLLAQDGLDASESNPQFHQQMVYAVAMTTIKNFESALGRPILWSQRRLKTDGEKHSNTQYVKTLRIYPHALRDANAFYSPQKKALLFGYFSSQPAEPTLQMPNTQIFTCLSHDIIAHETAHAILDGIYSNYTDDTNPDVLAFHEAFADIVALFQHFTFPEVLKNQIAKTRGNLASQNLLGQLAQEFGSAIGKYGSLRDAIGEIDEATKVWKAKEPNGDEYQTIFEHHQRGSILVSAVFDAFVTIYKSRIADLLRIATGGSGILPLGELHPDLINRLANEASKSAGHILKMCIRAIDYCPPVDITFGDYLRAIITADNDLVADDNRDYRLAFIDAFRKRGIYPTGIKSLSVESLIHKRIDNGNLSELFKILIKFLREFSEEIIYSDDYTPINNENIDHRERIFKITRDYITGRYDDDKKKIFGIHRRINVKFDGSSDFQNITGLIFGQNWPILGVTTSNSYNDQGPSFWVDSLKVASRVGPSGTKINQIIISLTQEAGIEIDASAGTKNVKTFVPKGDINQTSDKFIMKGGVTLIFDLKTRQLMYAISKPLIDTNDFNKINEKRAMQIHNYYNSDDSATFDNYFRLGKHNSAFETFSFLHNH